MLIRIWGLQKRKKAHDKMERFPQYCIGNSFAYGGLYMNVRRNGVCTKPLPGTFSFPLYMLGIGTTIICLTCQVCDECIFSTWPRNVMYTRNLYRHKHTHSQAIIKPSISRATRTKNPHPHTPSEQVYMLLIATAVHRNTISWSTYTHNTYYFICIWESATLYTNR